MLYHLFAWIEATFAPPGFQVFAFTTVRASLAAGTALLIALFAGKKIIRFLRKRQLGERVREGEDAGVVDHQHKAGTPTMGGVIILLALCGSTLLWADLTNPYILLAVLATLWMGAVGFADDYIKVVKENKEGLAEKTKIVGQVSLGLLVGTLLYFLPPYHDAATLTSLPFVPDGTIDYDFLSPLLGVEVGWLVYIPIVVFIITAVSNAVNLTDGLDGLTTGTSAFVALGLVALTYITGNAVAADFVNDIFIPGTSELVIFAAADHPLAKRKRLTLDDVSREPWILREPGSGTRQVFDSALRHELTHLDIRLELEHTEAIKRAVESGMGIGCISRLALKDAFRRGSLVPLEIAGLDLKRQFNFVLHRQKFRTAGIEAFLNLCREVTRDVKRSDEIVMRRPDGQPMEYR